MDPSALAAAGETPLLVQRVQKALAQRLPYSSRSQKGPAARLQSGATSSRGTNAFVARRALAVISGMILSHLGDISMRTSLVDRTSGI